MVTDPCEKCRGVGRVLISKKLSLKIPPGVESGSRLRLNGEGESGDAGAPAGDLYVYLNVKPHETFKREGDNVIVLTPISFPVAALGGQIEVPTLEGNEMIQIPKGTQAGQDFRIPGKVSLTFVDEGGGILSLWYISRRPKNWVRNRKTCYADWLN